MGQSITTNQGITIGLDVCDRFTEAYVIDGEGKWIESFRVPTTREGLATGHPPFLHASTYLRHGGLILQPPRRHKPRRGFRGSFQIRGVDVPRTGQLRGISGFSGTSQADPRIAPT